MPIPRSTTRLGMDSFQQAVLKREIYERYRMKRQVTIRELTSALDVRGIRTSKSAIHRTLLKLGFRFHKSGKGKRFIFEREDVVASRHQFLRNIRKAREDGDIIVYVDETWVNVNHSVKGEWSESDVSLTSKLLGDERGTCCKFTPTGKGQRLIVLDAGCRDVGLIPSVGEAFVAKCDTGDYHSEMNHKHFFDWWKNTLLPVLPGPSTIVIDNASYHSIMTEDSKSPNTATKKEDIRDWLRTKGIDFTDDMVKAELLDLVRRNKPRPRYIVDELAMAAGHRVLRLPPRHCELNPIELVWAKMKGHVARNNSTFKLADTKILFEASKALVTPEYWNKCEDHVINKVESELWTIDCVQEEEIAPVVISLNDDSDTEDELSDSDDNTDSDDIPVGVNEAASCEGVTEDRCGVCGLYEPVDYECGEIKWIGCDACERWTHVVCVNVSEKCNVDYMCKECKNILKTSF